MTNKEKIIFTRNVEELIEHTRLYGIPKEESTFVFDKMMFYRLKYIKLDSEKLILAKQIDKKGILFN